MQEVDAEIEPSPSPPAPEPSPQPSQVLSPDNEKTYETQRILREVTFFHHLVLYQYVLMLMMVAMCLYFSMFCTLAFITCLLCWSPPEIFHFCHHRLNSIILILSHQMPDPS